MNVMSSSEPNYDDASGVARAGEPLPAGQAVAAESDVIEALRNVYDPEIPVNIYDLGLIYELKVAETGTVQIEMTLTAPTCPVAGALPQQVADMVAAVPGVGEVSVNLVWDPPWTMEKLSMEARLALNLF